MGGILRTLDEVSVDVFGSVVVADAFQNDSAFRQWDNIGIPVEWRRLEMGLLVS